MTARNAGTVSEAWNSRLDIFMKVYGYSSKVDIGEGPLPLTEISFWGEPGVLREVAKFIEPMANEIQCNPDFDYRHLLDSWDKWTEEYPDVIIGRSK